MLIKRGRSKSGRRHRPWGKGPAGGKVVTPQEAGLRFQDHDDVPENLAFQEAAGERRGGDGDGGDGGAVAMAAAMAASVCVSSFLAA